jgi:hypothetical protein
MTQQTFPLKQLDLFVDSGVVVYVNEAIEALIKRDVSKAENCIQLIINEEPRNCSILQLQTLSRAIREWPFAASNPEQIAEAVKRLDLELQPSAQALMRSEAADFLRPFWEELASAAGSQVYDRAFTQSFCAGFYLRIGDYSATIRAVETVPNWDDIPDLLYWHSLARYRINGFNGCHATLLRLAFLAPKQFPIAISEMGDSILRKAWIAFKSDFDWLETDDESAGAWFPVWHIIKYSDSLFALDEVPKLATLSVQAFNLLVRIIQSEKRGISPPLVALRSKLRGLDQNVFNVYLAGRSISQR